MQFLMTDVKPRLFANTRTIDATRTAFNRFVLNADILEKDGAIIENIPLSYTYKEMLCCLKTDDDKKLFALLRKEFNNTTHEVDKMNPKEAKTFRELKERFSKRYENTGNQKYIAMLRQADVALRKENWVNRIERLIYKALLEHYLTLTKEKRILKISFTIDYVNLDDLETIITHSSEIQLNEKCNHCKLFFTTAQKLDRCIKCLKVFYCNEQCANNDSAKHLKDCTTPKD